MKVKIKDLLPNPFRDMENYPINECKVESLINSIDETGFWENILARKKDDKFEIAYGHHRLVALKKIFQPDDEVDIPVKKISDEIMIKIMANENNELWGTNIKIIDETVRVVRQYLERRHIFKNIPPRKPGSHTFKAFDGLPLPEPKETKHSIIAWQISNWLGRGWPERRVYHSIERLGLIEKGELDREAVESLPHETASTKFAKAIEQVKDVKPEQQKRAVKKIIERQDFSQWGIKSTVLEEKYEKKEKTEAEKKAQKVENFITRFAKDMKQVNRDIDTAKRYREQYNLDFETGSKNLEISSFILEFQILLKNIEGLGYKITKKKSLNKKEEEGK